MGAIHAGWWRGMHGQGSVLGVVYVVVQGLARRIVLWTVQGYRAEIGVGDVVHRVRRSYLF
jgi:hypothetical protein